MRRGHRARHCVGKRVLGAGGRARVFEPCMSTHQVHPFHCRKTATGSAQPQHPDPPQRLWQHWKGRNRAFPGRTTRGWARRRCTKDAVGEGGSG